MRRLFSALMLLSAVICVPKYMNSLTTSNFLDPKVKEHVSWLWLLFFVENIYLVLEIFNCKPMSFAAPTILSTAVSRDLMPLVIISRSSAYPRICRALLYIVPEVSMLAARIIILRKCWTDHMTDHHPMMDTLLLWKVLISHRRLSPVIWYLLR